MLSVDNGSPEYDADVILQLKTKFPALRWVVSFLCVFVVCC